jgi:hypothetical protein
MEHPSKKGGRWPPSLDESNRLRSVHQFEKRLALGMTCLVWPGGVQDSVIKAEFKFS